MPRAQFSAAVQSLVQFLNPALSGLCRHGLSHLDYKVFLALQCHVGSTVPIVPITTASTRPATYGERLNYFALASLWQAVAS